MRILSETLSEFEYISANPKAQLKKYLDLGKKVIGCMPYYCPEELVHAAGMTPFGLWGAETLVSEARRYLPSFICSIIQTTLELGIKGEYAGLSAVMIPTSCDSLKSMDANWRYGVKNIPPIPVAHAQNRKTTAGAEFTASQYRKVLSSLEKISGKRTTEGDIKESIALYNKRNATVRLFIEELSKHPGAMTPSARNAVFKSAYFMDVTEYTEKMSELIKCLSETSAPSPRGPNLVLCGIIADNTGLLEILDDCGVNVIDDMVAHESLRYRFDAPETPDPIMSLALTIGSVEGCPVLYDPGKKRGDMLLDIVRQRSADGVLFVMTKHCDPEEYDIVPIKKLLDKNGIKNLRVEVDQQTIYAGQIRTAIETFCQII